MSEKVKMSFPVIESDNCGLKMLSIISEVMDEFYPRMNPEQDLAATKYLESIIKSRLENLGE